MNNGNLAWTAAIGVLIGAWVHASAPSPTATDLLDAAKYVARIEADGPGSASVLALGNHGDGAVTVAGQFVGTVVFGATTLVSAGSGDAYVARMDPDGTWAWATRAGGIDVDGAQGVGTLADGGAIVAGYFGGSATFGATTLASAGLNDAFVARVLPDGTWAWVTHVSGVRMVVGQGVGTLADGGAIITGHFDGDASFGTTTLTDRGGDAFVARIHPDGSWSWVTHVHGTGLLNTWAVSALADGGAVVAGSFHFATTLGTATLASAGHGDVLVARIRPDGTWAWATRAGGPGLDAARAVSALPDGGAIVAGSFDGSATFGATTLISAGGIDAFVARVHPDGTWAWAAAAGSRDRDVAHSVGALPDGGAIVVGEFCGCCEVLDGVTCGAATFGATTLTSAGWSDAFAARLHPDGTWAWAARAGGPDADRASAVGTLADGDAIVAGHFTEEQTFDTITGHAFVARIDTSFVW